MTNATNVRKNKSYFPEKTRLDWIWLIFVFLFSLNLYNNAMYLMIFTLIIGLVITFYKGSGFKFTIEFLLLLLFTFSYFLILYINSNAGLYSMVLYFFGPIGCFFVGYFIVKTEKKIIVNTIFAILIGNFFHGLLNMINYLNSFGVSSSQRSVPDIWSGIYTAATLEGSHFTLLASLLFFTFTLFTKKSSFIWIIMLLAGIFFSIFTSFILGNRTLIIITIVIFLLNSILYILLKRNSLKQILSAYLYIAFFIIMIAFIYSIDFLGIKDFILTSQLFNRIEDSSINEDPRLVVYGRAITQMFDFPFGGYQMDLGLRFAHNLWIDVLYATGLIPFFFLFLFTVKTIYNGFYILINPYVEVLFKILFFSVNLGYLLNFMVEPILEGATYMFLSFCLINGMISKYMYTLRFQKKLVGKDKRDI
ncbi:hypothetical protein ACIP97_03350 [Peribacillus frigoritolerans]|uniref:hypothetical protein n=1 Tax=Peribacillus frigoritolerans TaxID=450367 RepID=UPI003812DFAA